MVDSFPSHLLFYIPIRYYGFGCNEMRLFHQAYRDLHPLLVGWTADAGRVLVDPGITSASDISDAYISPLRHASLMWPDDDLAWVFYPSRRPGSQ